MMAAQPGLLALLKIRHSDTTITTKMIRPTIQLTGLTPPSAAGYWFISPPPQATAGQPGGVRGLRGVAEGGGGGLLLAEVGVEHRRVVGGDRARRARRDQRGPR